ncbi:MAG: tetraacyldisaccharide 4'-kinase [Phycisphaerales bacterium]
MMPARLLLPLSQLYLLELKRRNRGYDRGRKVRHVGVPVISVGNLSVGGTGKTPTVRCVCSWLIEAGHRPTIAMRGYKAGPAGSDEQLEYERLLPGVPVVADADRYRAVRAFLTTEEGKGRDCVVLDDGFQHRRLRRDLDIVLIDASRSPFDDAPLPAGRLREPPSALARAQGVIVTHAELVEPASIDRLVDRVCEVAPKAVTAIAEHVWSGLLVREGACAPRAERLDWLRGRRVVAACGIGHPKAFFAAAERAIGGPPAEAIALPDHARFDAAQRARIARSVRRHGADCVLVTLKDEVKLGSAVEWGVPVVCAVLELAFRSGLAGLRDRVVAAVEGTNG